MHCAHVKPRGLIFRLHFNPDLVAIVGTKRFLGQKEQHAIRLPVKVIHVLNLVATTIHLD